MPRSGPLRARPGTGPGTRPRAARARVHRARSGRRVGGAGMLSRLTPMLMRMSTLFVRTLREDPADAEVPSHRLLSLIHISEPTRLGMISYAVFCLKKKKK